MSDDDLGVKIEAASALGKMGDITGIEALIRFQAKLFIDSSASDIFERAFRELGAAALEPLVRSLEDSDPDTRKASAHRLGRLQEYRAIEPLAQALSLEEKHWVGVYIAGALARLGDPRGISFLVENLGRVNWINDENICKALVETGKPAVEPVVSILNDYKTKDLAAKILIQIGAESTQAVISALANQDAEFRALAAKILGSIGDPRAKDPLVQAMNDKSEAVRLQAAISLCSMGDSTAVDSLIQVLWQHEQKYILGSIAYALGRSGNTRAVPPLVSCLGKDLSSDVKCSVVKALGDLRDARAVDALIKIVNVSWVAGGALSVWENAVDALGKIGDKRAIEPLTRWLTSEGEGRPTVASALAKIDERNQRYYNEIVRAETEKVLKNFKKGLKWRE
jgi:HEAT repeat protein